jgi:DNA invertase Pin-like site-specific DNA recombinase
MNIGYARVSIEDQTLDLQFNALKNAGCERIFSDVTSGNTRERAGLSQALELLNSGDTLTIRKLDRLGRSIRNLIDLSDQLLSRNVHLVSLTDSIKHANAFRTFFFNVMAALAEMEHGLIKERTRAGLEAARQAGRTGGRKPSMTPEKIQAAKSLLDGRMAMRDVASSLGVSVPTVYRYFPASKRE